jgi:thiol-disulfide isomerase/thioredoxin
MKRNILYGFVILLLLGISALGLAYSNNRQSAITQNATSSAQPTQQTNPPSTNEPKKLGVYVDYSENAIADADGTILLFFHAPWCPQCRQLDADIKKNTIPDGVTIIKVDYDSNQDLRKKYGVTLQTSIVRVDENGEFISKYVAYNEPTLNSVITNMLMQ